jgi:hypothetical protein
MLRNVNGTKLQNKDWVIPAGITWGKLPALNASDVVRLVVVSVMHYGIDP